MGLDSSVAPCSHTGGRPTLLLGLNCHIYPYENVVDTSADMILGFAWQGLLAQILQALPDRACGLTIPYFCARDMSIFIRLPSSSSGPVLLNLLPIRPYSRPNRSRCFDLCSPQPELPLRLNRALVRADCIQEADRPPIQ